MHDEITLICVERSKKLLLESDLKAPDLAEQCGFGDAVDFSKAFTRITGVRPNAVHLANIRVVKAACGKTSTGSTGTH